MSDPERVVPVSMHGLKRVMAWDGAMTVEFDHAPSVTLVSERNRRKWEAHDRPEDAGDVFFLTDDDEHQIRYSKKGIKPAPDVRIIREASANVVAGESPEQQAGEPRWESYEGDGSESPERQDTETAQDGDSHE